MSLASWDTSSLSQRSRYSHISRSRCASRQCTRSNSSTIWSKTQVPGASNEELHFDHHLDHCVDVAAIVCTPHTYGCPNAIPDRDPPDEM
jgi:hypothetical protein